MTSCSVLALKQVLDRQFPKCECNMLKKITYINMLVAGCTGTALLLFLYLQYPREFVESNDLGTGLFIGTAFVGIVGFTTQLIGRTIIGQLWAFRLMVVLSILWFLFCVVAIEPLQYDSLYHFGYYNISTFVLVCLTPLAVIWGLVWVLKAVAKDRAT